MDKEKEICAEEEPEWLKQIAQSMLRGPKVSYGDEDQDDIMNLIDENKDDQL